MPFPTENFSLPPREHKKVNYAEFETFSDSSSENNRKQNHGNYISWSASEDAILIEQVQKFMESQKMSNDNDNDENQNNNINPINSLNNSNNNENNSNLNKEKNLPENKPKIKQEDNSININPTNINPLANINWGKIAEKLENKNARQCQTRWQNILDPNRVKGPWTKEEDMKLIELVKKFGPEKWSNISSYLPGRLGKQCRERWYNHLNPEVRKTGWSKEEEWVLFLLHRKHGNSWSTFSEKIPGRTDNTIKNHWNSIMKKNIVGITNQYQEMIKGKSKEEIEEIEKSIMAKCSEAMHKDYNEYIQEKMKEFPMMKLSKHNKKEKEKEKEKENDSFTNNNLSKSSVSKKNLLDIAINTIEIKTPTKNKKKIFENVKISKRTSKSKSKNKNKYKYKKNEKKEESKEKERKHEGRENKKQSSSKKNSKYFNVNDDKELKIIKSGEKVLQQDKNILIKEAENKYKEKQKLKKGEKKNKSMSIIHRKIEEENEENNKNLEKMKTFSNKKTAKKPKRKNKNKSSNNRKKKKRFNVSKLSNKKERESPKTNNNISNIKLNFNNPYINSSGNNNNLSPDFMSNNNMNFPYPVYQIEKFPYYIEDENKILITDSKDINMAKKEGQFPQKILFNNGPFLKTDNKKSSESSGGNNSLGQISISPDSRMNPAFLSNNDNFYPFTIPQNLNKRNIYPYSNSNPQMVRLYKRGENNNNNNKISTDSSVYSMISAKSAFTPSSGSSGSFQKRGGGFIKTTNLNNEYFASINLDEKLNNKM